MIIQEDKLQEMRASYREALLQSIPMIRHLFSRYLSIKTEMEIVRNLVSYEPVKNSRSTNVTLFLQEDEARIAFAPSGSPYVDMDTEVIYFPPEFASDKFCRAYFEIDDEDFDVEPLKWLLSYYAIFHEALHLKLKNMKNEEDEQEGDSYNVLTHVVNNNRIKNVIRNFVLDVYIENRIAQQYPFVGEIVTIAKNLFTHPYKICKLAGLELNVSHLHSLRSHEYKEFLTNIDKRFEKVDSLMENYWKLSRFKALLSYLHTVDEIERIFFDPDSLSEKSEGSEQSKDSEGSEQSKDSEGSEQSSNFQTYAERKQKVLDEKARQEKRLAEIGANLGKGFENKWMYSLADRTDRLIDSRAFILEEFLRREARMAFHLSESRYSFSDLRKTNQKAAYPMGNFSWVKKCVESLFIEKKRKVSREFYHEKGMLDLTAPDSVFSGQCFSQTNIFDRVRKRPNFVIAIDGSSSMGVGQNSLLGKCLSFVFNLSEALAKRGFSVSSFIYSGSSSQTDITYLHSSRSRLPNGVKTTLTLPKENVFSNATSRGVTPEFYGLSIAKKFFNLQSNEQKFLIVFCDGEGNVWDTSTYQTNEEACKAQHKLNEKLGIETFYVALDSSVYDSLIQQYGNEKVVNGMKKEEFEKGLKRIFSKVEKFA